MAGLPQLTRGICARLANSENEDSEELFNSQPTLQLLSFKKVPPTGGGNNVDRYRVIVSDGEHFLQSMLATQLNHLVEEDAIGKGAVAVIEKFTCNIVQGKRLLIILALRVLVKTTEKMGSPGPVQGRPEGGASTPAAETPGPSTSTNITPAPPAAAAAQAPRQQTQANRNGRAAAIYPIESLSPYQNHWTIKARAMNKSDIRTWVNQRGEGKLFSVTLMDDSGEIRATAFNAAVDLFYDKIQEGKVYLISKAKVNLAKKKFSNVNNEYELTFERNTEVEECLDVTDVPTVKFNFVPISGLQDVSKDATCDIIGVVKEVGELSTITSKATSKVIPKRELTVVDRSNYAVRVTLWGKQAEQFEATDQPVIAFKGVKVGDFQGRSLSMMSSSSMHMNPDIPEAHALRGWFDAAGSDQTFQAHTSTFTGGGGITFDRAEVRNLNEVKTAEFGMSDKPEYFCAQATIMHIKNDTISYPACPSQGCNKKVVELGDSWRCEKCDKSYPKPQHRYMVSMAVSDYSGQAWFSGFNDVGETIFGMPADELVDIRERDDSQFNQVVERAIGTTYNFACRAKQDSYNEATRVRYAINRIMPLNYREETKYLANILTHSDWAR
ncbi:replication factor-a protein [Lentinus brumalis]|uniref:Replication protein A subunit n=1 Tax=Lentinus brumalis TaxID=2498619 RepID=A0A371DV80_9APHY|nr:replication factor-a protein [Polyporus brumalis]